MKVFKTMINSFTQSGLNMKVLYVSSQPKFIGVPTFVGLSNSVSKGKHSLLSNDLLQRINDIIFNNAFIKWVYRGS
jgi:hypothetical protein